MASGEAAARGPLMAAPVRASWQPLHIRSRRARHRSRCACPAQRRRVRSLHGRGSELSRCLESALPSSSTGTLPRYCRPVVWSQTPSRGSPTIGLSFAGSATRATPRCVCLPEMADASCRHSPDRWFAVFGNCSSDTGAGFVPSGRGTPTSVPCVSTGGAGPRVNGIGLRQEICGCVKRYLVAEGIQQRHRITPL